MMAPTSALLVTIHDVTPALQQRVKALWALCAERGVIPGLYVVPDWHGGSPIEGDAAFAEWLRDRAADGAEILLHGERHDEVGLPRRWRDEMRAFGRTNKEGEFLTLDYDAARSRIDRGVARLHALGLAPIGFVPPAWLAKRATHDAVRDAGLAVSETDSAIFVHATRVTIASPVLRWSARGAFRSYGSVLQERIRWRTQRHTPVMRIALHPADLDHPAVERNIHQALDAWIAVRTPGRYGEL
jgi:predicted deacetylase